MAVFVALFLLGGAVQAANHVAAPAACAIELDDSSALDVALPAPVAVIAVVRATSPIVMPAVAPLIAVPFAARTFRPPRG